MSKKNLDKTHQAPNRTWVIPQDQVDEFMSGPINYKKLVTDCLKDRNTNNEVVLKSGATKKRFWERDLFGNDD